jgi:hypothetical protein
MANTSNEPNGLKGRVAAEKLAGLKQTAKQKVAAAWTLAKTMLPGAPQAEQLKFASTLMENSPVTLKIALKQTAVNAHWTRVAEQFASVHKVDMNDLLEDPSVLNKETKGVSSELKGDAKSAGAKKADDRKDAGPQPAEYPDPKRDEPAPLDGSNAGKGRPDSWTEGPGAGESVNKSASKHGEGCECATCKKADKKASKHGEGCECAECKKDKKASAKKACPDGCNGDKDCEHDHGKKASVKTAEEGEAPVAEDAAPADEAGAAEGEADAAEGDAAGADEAAGDADADAALADADAALPDDGEADAGEGEEFDPAKANLEDAAADLENDINQLQDAIADLSAEPDDITFNGEEGADAEAGAADEDAQLADLFADGAEGDASAAEGDAQGEELNLDDIFNENNMSDKVSSLNDEGDNIDELIVELNGNDDFFGPSDPSELESILEQEDTIEDPHDIFAIRSSADPMAALFGKQASETNIVKPGDIVKALDTDLAGGEDRDSETDHDGTIFEEVLNSIKQPTRDDHRVGDGYTEPTLKAAAKKVVPKQAGIRKLRPGSGKTASSANLASLLFTDDADYM